MGLLPHFLQKESTEEKDYATKKAKFQELFGKTKPIPPQNAYRFLNELGTLCTQSSIAKTHTKEKDFLTKEKDFFGEQLLRCLAGEVGDSNPGHIVQLMSKLRFFIQNNQRTLNSESSTQGKGIAKEIKRIEDAINEKLVGEFKEIKKDLKVIKDMGEFTLSQLGALFDQKKKALEKIQELIRHWEQKDAFNHRPYQRIVYAFSAIPFSQDLILKGFSDNASNQGRKEHHLFARSLKELAESLQDEGDELIVITMESMFKELNVPEAEREAETYENHLKNVKELKRKTQRDLEKLLTAANALKEHIKKTKTSTDKKGDAAANEIFKKVKENEKEVLKNLKEEERLYDNFKKESSALLKVAVRLKREIED